VTAELVHHERTSPKGLSTGCFAISHLGDFCPCFVGGEAGGAEMVVELVETWSERRYSTFMISGVVYLLVAMRDVPAK
jgi:hypothetical protein